MPTGAAATPDTQDNISAPTPARDYLVRSEEQIRVRTDQEVAGYARLERFTVTETKTVTVEVTHEEVRLVHRAADSGLPDHPGPDSAATDASQWMVLSREEVEITKRVVPVERVRIEVYPVVEQRQVTEQLRKEQIDSTPETDGVATHHSGPLS